MTENEYSQLKTTFDTFQSNQSEKWSKRFDDARKDLISFEIGQITMLGVLAGFGFTATSSVNTDLIYLFILGELVQVIAISNYVIQYWKNFRVHYDWVNEVNLFLIEHARKGIALYNVSLIDYENVDYETARLQHNELMMSCDISGITQKYKLKLKSNKFMLFSMIFCGTGFFMVLISLITNNQLEATISFIKNVPFFIYMMSALAFSLLIAKFSG